MIYAMILWHGNECTYESRNYSKTLSDTTLEILVENYYQTKVMNLRFIKLYIIHVLLLLWTMPQKLKLYNIDP